MRGILGNQEMEAWSTPPRRRRGSSELFPVAGPVVCPAVGSGEL
jgi:hypothetical protein